MDLLNSIFDTKAVILDAGETHCCCEEQDCEIDGEHCDEQELY